MLKSPNDRRAIRTRKMIRSALSELIEEKGYNNISITDLAARADINRGTFYLHYNDKYDLLEQVENEVLKELHDGVMASGFSDTTVLTCIEDMGAIEKPMPFMISVFEYIKENSKFFKAILGPRGDQRFQIKLKKLIETNLYETILNRAIKDEHMLIPEEYFISYVLSAHLGVIQKWLDGGMKEAPYEMALILSKMFFLGAIKAAGIK